MGNILDLKKTAPPDEGDEGDTASQNLQPEPNLPAEAPVRDAADAVATPEEADERVYS